MEITQNRFITIKNKILRGEIMDINRRKLAEEILQTVTYFDMDEEQTNLVVEYELEIYKPKVDKLKERFNNEKVEEKIHDWWLDYRIADETEDALMKYLYN